MMCTHRHVVAAGEAFGTCLQETHRLNHHFITGVDPGNQLSYLAHDAGQVVPQDVGKGILIPGKPPRTTRRDDSARRRTFNRTSWLRFLESSDLGVFFRTLRTAVLFEDDSFMMTASGRERGYAEPLVRLNEPILISTVALAGD
jgi:hypothetical protein